MSKDSVKRAYQLCGENELSSEFLELLKKYNLGEKYFLGLRLRL